MDHAARGVDIWWLHAESAAQSGVGRKLITSTMTDGKHGLGRQVFALGPEDMRMLTQAAESSPYFRSNSAT